MKSYPARLAVFLLGFGALAAVMWPIILWMDSLPYAGRVPVALALLAVLFTYMILIGRWANKGRKTPQPPH